MVQCVAIYLQKESWLIFYFRHQKSWGFLIDGTQTLWITPLSYAINGHHILIAQPALYLATKIEAFLSRGQNEPFDSQDLEDIVALIDGCTELVTSFQEQDQELREWIGSHLGDIQSQSWFETLCIGNLPRGGDERTREQQFLARWKRLTG